MTLAEFCALLRTVRRQRGVRQCDAAAAVGVSQSTFARWETGRCRPLDEKLRAWAHVLDTPVPPGVRGDRIQGCGTRSGYQRHLKTGEDACRPCLDAHSAYMRSRRSRPARSVPPITAKGRDRS